MTTFFVLLVVLVKIAITLVIALVGLAALVLVVLSFLAEKSIPAMKEGAERLFEPAAVQDERYAIRELETWMGKLFAGGTCVALAMLGLGIWIWT